MGGVSGGGEGAVPGRDGGGVSGGVGGAGGTCCMKIFSAFPNAREKGGLPSSALPNRPGLL